MAEGWCTLKMKYNSGIWKYQQNGGLWFYIMNELTLDINLGRVFWYGISLTCEIKSNLILNPLI